MMSALKRTLTSVNVFNAILLIGLSLTRSKSNICFITMSHSLTYELFFLNERYEQCVQLNERINRKSESDEDNSANMSLRSISKTIRITVIMTSIVISSQNRTPIVIYTASEHFL